MHIAGRLKRDMAGLGQTNQVHGGSTPVSGMSKRLGHGRHWRRALMAIAGTSLFWGSAIAPARLAAMEPDGAPAIAAEPSGASGLRDARWVTAAPLQAAMSPLQIEPIIPYLPPAGTAEDFLPEAVVSISLVIDLSDRNVTVYEGAQVVAQYPIAIGRSGWETPVGEHRVMQMVVDPAWEHPWTGEVIPPGPDNPLGVRWIGFWTDGVNAIGFHGTPNEASVGTAASHGCIRMYNQDVVQLYEMVRLGTTVAVVP